MKRINQVMNWVATIATVIAACVIAWQGGLISLTILLVSTLITNQLRRIADALEQSE